jgi:hypothetical protein
MAGPDRPEKMEAGNSSHPTSTNGVTGRVRVPSVAEVFGRNAAVREPGAIRRPSGDGGAVAGIGASGPGAADVLEAVAPVASVASAAAASGDVAPGGEMSKRGDPGANGSDRSNSGAVIASADIASAQQADDATAADDVTATATATATATNTAACAEQADVATAAHAAASTTIAPATATCAAGPASSALSSATPGLIPPVSPGRRSPSARRDEEEEPRWLVDRFVGFQFAEEQFLPGQGSDVPYPPDKSDAGLFPGPGSSPDQPSAAGFTREGLLSGRFDEPLGGPDRQPGTARLATPGTVAAAVPYFFGFHPSSSVVVLGLLRSGHSPRAAISQGLRVDLGRIQRNPAGFGRWLARRLTADGVTEVLGLLYPPEPGPARLGDHRRTIAGLCAPLRQAGIATLDVLMVARSRWWSFLCENPHCCPPDGSPIDFAGSPVAALSAYTGLAIMPSRQALAQALAPHDPKVRQETEQECRRAVRRFPELKPRSSSRDRIVLPWAGVIRGWAAADEIAHRVAEDAVPVAEALTGELAGQLLTALPDVRVRDYLAGWCGGPRAGLCLDLAIELARRAVNERQTAAGYSVGAWAAWAVGWGAWSRLCLDRAMAAMPDYSLAVLIEQGLERGVDPGMVRNAATGTAMQLADMLADPES